MVLLSERFPQQKLTQVLLIATQNLFAHAASILCFTGLFLTTFHQSLVGQESVELQENQKRIAVIIVGLPGDKEHESLFEQTTMQWTQWLIKRCQFAKSDIHLFSGRDDGIKQLEETDQHYTATRDSIERRITSLKSTLKKEDVFWVFFLGHADDSNRHALFHLPGPDMDEQGVGELFQNIPCEEQVFWLTHACSGLFLKSLSNPGRILITATVADTEINETEFPKALVFAAQQDPKILDTNKDGKVSIREVFEATANQVEFIFKSDSRVPTEHALLDDNGDGKGTELPELAQLLTEGKSKSEGLSITDGLLSSQTFLPTANRDSADNPTRATK